MSISEEQAETFVVSLSWSAPGLALHRRSVLAILTSNHILSLWASNSDPTKSESWQRVLVINDFERPDSSQPTRRQYRIRCYTWAPPAPCYGISMPCSVWKWGMHVLAVSDDHGSMQFLSILSPIMCGCDSWTCVRVEGMDLSKMDSRGIYRVNRSSASQGKAFHDHYKTSLFNESMQVRPFIDAIIFSPWVKKKSERSVNGIWDDNVTWETIVSFHARGSLSSIRLVHQTGHTYINSMNFDFHVEDMAQRDPIDPQSASGQPVVWEYCDVRRLVGLLNCADLAR